MEPEKGIIIALSGRLLLGVKMCKAPMIWNKIYLHFI